MSHLLLYTFFSLKEPLCLSLEGLSRHSSGQSIRTEIIYILYVNHKATERNDEDKNGIWYMEQDLKQRTHVDIY